ncbi:MAG: phage coat protein [Clostridiales bacterium]|nr:phage coat protein [Clostridiales bacterium]
MAKFNYISFNGTAFGSYIERLPKIKKDELIKSGVLVGNNNIKNAFSSQTGTAYAEIPFFGNIGGKALNYDGKTDITAEKVMTSTQGVVVVGRSKAWIEDDFSVDITGGVDFMTNVANQVSTYWDEIDQLTLVSILDGIFKMTGTASAKFVENHTLDLTTGRSAMKMDATTLNIAIQKACGSNKNAFSLAIMHSSVATNLENLNLLDYMKYTDASGIQRDLTIGTLNGKTVIIDDSCTFDGTDKYTTYVLGKGSFYFEDIGVEVPYAMTRDEKTNGGQTTLYTRQRKCFAPFGISYTKASQDSLSPTDEELAKGENWKLIGDDDANSETIDDKTIAIARIISKG